VGGAGYWLVRTEYSLAIRELRLISEGAGAEADGKLRSGSVGWGWRSRAEFWNTGTSAFAVRTCLTAIGVTLATLSAA
jgi:hypothetical protein